MKWSFLIIFLLSIVNVDVLCQDNYFIAGEINENSTYFDIIPDTLISVFDYNPGISNGAYEKYDIDFNLDTYTDFHLSVSFSHNGEGWGSWSTSINSFNENKIFYGRLDTILPSPQYGEDTSYVQIAKIYNLGDTIFFNQDSISTNSSFCYKVYSPYSSGSAYDWKDIGIKYIGFYSNPWGIPTLGWIKVEVVEFLNGSIQLRIFEYASNQLFVLDTKEDLLEPKLKVFPNPCHNHVYLKINDSGHRSNGHYRLYNSFGRKVQEGSINGKLKELKMDLNGFPDGFYFLSLDIGSQNYFEKIIKQ